MRPFESVLFVDSCGKRAYADMYYTIEKTIGTR